MDTVLGILGIIVYAAAVIALAAGVTYSVIRLFPLAGSKNKKPPKPAAE